MRKLIGKLYASSVARYVFSGTCSSEDVQRWLIWSAFTCYGVQVSGLTLQI